MDQVMEVSAPKGASEVRLLQLPEYGMGWLHFFDSKGVEDVKSQEFLCGLHDLVGFSDGIVKLTTQTK